MHLYVQPFLDKHVLERSQGICDTENIMKLYILHILPNFNLKFILFQLAQPRNHAFTSKFH